MSLTLTDTYSYRTHDNIEVFEKRRYVDERGKKTFKIFHSGNVPGLGDRTPVLYNLPAISGQEQVWICEGEKDVETLKALGRPATTNFEGAGGWNADLYTQTLWDKSVVLLPDNDEAGKAHAQKVAESLEGVCSDLRVLLLPDSVGPKGDITTLVEKEGKQAAAEWLRTAYRDADVLERGVNIPVYSHAELEREYIQYCKTSEGKIMDLAQWCPSFRHFIRPLVPGELCVWIANTGVGKSAILQNLCRAYTDLPILFFEFELPGAAMFERNLSMISGMEGFEVEKEYRAGRRIKASGMENVYICDKAGLTIPQIEELIIRSALKIGSKPAVVMLDYIGLVQAAGSKSRYERMSDIAEQIKVMAKTHNLIIHAATQKKRTDGDSPTTIPPTLHDCKDSGSIENSAQLIFGCSRDPNNPRVERGNPAWMNLLCLKGTRGGAGRGVQVYFHSNMVMEERGCFDDHAGTMTVTNNSPGTT